LLCRGIKGAVSRKQRGSLRGLKTTMAPRPVVVAVFAGETAGLTIIDTSHPAPRRRFIAFSLAFLSLIWGRSGAVRVVFSAFGRFVFIAFRSFAC